MDNERKLSCPDSELYDAEMTAARSIERGYEDLILGRVRTWSELRKECDAHRHSSAQQKNYQ